MKDRTSSFHASGFAKRLGSVAPRRSRISMQTERSPSFGVEGERGSSYAVSCRTCFLHITKACNLRCRHCYFAAGTTLPNELSTEEIARLWPAMVTLRPGKVVFTGGEPLLRLDTLDLLRGLRDADADHVIKRCLNTNGSLVTPELAKQLVGLADEVRISVDALRDRHDSLRGDGSFDAAMRALDCLYNVGFEPIAVITVSRNGLCDLEELICQLIARNIRRIKLNALRTIGRGSTRKESRVDDDAVRATMLRAWRRCFPDQPSPTEPYTSAGPSNCGIGSFLNIVPNWPAPQELIQVL